MTVPYLEFRALTDGDVRIFIGGVSGPRISGGNQEWQAHLLAWRMRFETARAYEKGYADGRARRTRDNPWDRESAAKQTTTTKTARNWPQ